MSTQTNIKAPAFGVLLVNLGTPDAPDKKAVKRYLKEFLSDRRVVDLSPIIWQPILNLIILTIRPKRVAKLYQKVWMQDGSPLLVLGNRLAGKLNTLFNPNGLDKEGAIPIVHAMTYGFPSIQDGAKVLRKRGVKRILVVPMYPQFSGTTTAAVYDKLFASLKTCPSWPEMHLLRDYADHPLYISALVESIRHQWEKQGGKRHLVFSYHGIPKRYADKGDPYPTRCLLTSQLVADALELADSEWTHAYQSRFGREEWLTPYASDVLTQLPGQGVKDVNIISPAFAVDCLETLEEICHELKDVFQSAGGQDYDYIPALNDDENQVALYQKLISSNTKMWKKKNDG